MATEVDMGDQAAWDDSYLINSWDEAAAEYKRYHSIHKSGKRLEDVLTEEELRNLKQDYGDLLQETEAASAVAAPNGYAGQDDTEMSQSTGTKAADQSNFDKQEPSLSGQQKTSTAEPEPRPALHNGLVDAPMPQAILGTVQDENLKNVIMSWYYAGYYTGLYAGQQQTAEKESPKQ